MVSLYPHQRDALEKLRSGSILVGGVGTGKSRTSLAYYFEKEHGYSNQLFIITTARKRDTGEWEQELKPFESDGYSAELTVDSWNNIAKYRDVKGAFFIFDEQRVVGSGSWVKSFLRIVRANRWILLTATPGDTWMDYIPVFIANGFYRNRTAFTQEHCIYSRFSKYPKVERYLGEGKLNAQRRSIMVQMSFSKKTKPHHLDIHTDYDRQKTKDAMKTRWNPFKDEPIQDAGGLCYVLRRISNEDPSRIQAVLDILKERHRAIIFYNFDYELEALRKLDILKAEWNGHKHEPLPCGDDWVYLVHYTAGAEGWNCVVCDTIIFFSQNYSYKTMVQSAGRIDRLNTPYTDLYYYHLHSSSPIDIAISKALRNKQDFNERAFASPNKHG